MVERALEKGGEEELLRLMAHFRQCFVDALQPKHLSSSWQINHRYAVRRDVYISMSIHSMPVSDRIELETLHHARQ